MGPCNYSGTAPVVTGRKPSTVDTMSVLIILILAKYIIVYCSVLQYSVLGNSSIGGGGVISSLYRV